MLHQSLVCTAGTLEAILRIMKPLSRRTFLAGSAAITAQPVLGQTRKAPLPKEQRAPPEVVIVGAGAAGIAAARRLAAAGRRFALFEAAATIGGRCITETATFGVPYDRGAHWIHMPDINPVAKLGTGTGLDIYPAPPGQRMRIGHRYAREAEMEDYLAATVRASTAIGDAARKGDISCLQALPKDLGSWRPTIEFVLGPFGCGKDLAEVSAADFSRSLERDTDALCRQGFGALLAKLASGLPVELSSPVRLIDWGARTSIDVTTARGDLKCRAVIVTVSTNLLTAGKIRFDPELPKRYPDAAAKLRLGSYDHIALELVGNPLGLKPDELVLEKCDSSKTASLFGNASGTPLCLIDVAGSFGRDLAAKGDAAMVDFAVGWLTNLYGGDIAKAVGRRHVTHWNDEPWVQGAFSAAAPGAQSARRVLMEPVGVDRIWFAGEAAHETLWGTVGGAWESGERAADAVIRALGKKGA
jgi:monoamine oxidase